MRSNTIVLILNSIYFSCPFCTFVHLFHNLWVLNSGGMKPTVEANSVANRIWKTLTCRNVALSSLTTSRPKEQRAPFVRCCWPIVNTSLVCKRDGFHCWKIITADAECGKRTELRDQWIQHSLSTWIFFPIFTPFPRVYWLTGNGWLNTIHNSRINNFCWLVQIWNAIERLLIGEFLFVTISRQNRTNAIGGTDDSSLSNATKC